MEIAATRIVASTYSHSSKIHCTIILVGVNFQLEGKISD